jgi:hypothetical protein
MKKIKINFCKYDPKDKCSYSYYILNILKKYYEIEISKKPDYLFFNESDPEYLSWNAKINIFYTGENIHPNFNQCDYAIGFDYLNLQDRYFRLPIYMVSNFYRPEELTLYKDVDISKNKYFSRKNLIEKDSFCSFVYSNYLADIKRKIFFEKLNTYKKVNSGGRYLNNTGKICSNKLAFEKRHKFSIAFENSSREGYTTEKLLNSIAADTVPIYWGNPKINLEFNDKRFVNCHNFKDFDEVIKYIINIDKDDSKYLEIINSNFLNEKNQFSKIEKEFEIFLKNIFDQDIANAKRIHINQAIKENLEKQQKFFYQYNFIKNIILKILSTAYKPFKKNRFIENYKHKFFIKE